MVSRKFGDRTHGAVDEFYLTKEEAQLKAAKLKTLGYETKIETTKVYQVWVFPIDGAYRK